MSSPNAIYLGDTVKCRLPWATDSFEATVVRIDDWMLHLEAVEKSDDPLVDNHFRVSYRDVTPLPTKRRDEESA